MPRRDVHHVARPECQLLTIVHAHREAREEGCDQQRWRRDSDAPAAGVRLLGIAMPLCLLGVTVLGWSVLVLTGGGISLLFLMLRRGAAEIGDGG